MAPRRPRAAAGTSGEAADITIGDLDQSGPITPDDIPWMGNEKEPPVDAIVVDDLDDDGTPPRSRLKSGWQPAAIEAAPSTGPPKLEEWLDFFSRVLIGTATDFLIEMSFRGVDEDLLSDREVDTIKLAREERDRIAKPLAEFASKNKYTRRHGREIIALSGSIDAILQLGIWYVRMTRIAMKYKRMTQGPQPSRRERMRNRPRTQPPQHQHQQRVVIIPPEGVNDSERTGQSPTAGQNGHHDDNWRPDVAGPVYNPGG